MELARRDALARAWLAGVFAVAAFPVTAGEFLIVGPSGSQSFGYYVTALPNGNIVIQDPWGPTLGGAVYLYGPTGTLISTLTGSVEGDSIGADPVIVLPSGNFLVVSYFWRNGDAEHAGAVTWVDANVGLDGEVSSANSLVGASPNDLVGGITILANGNYVVRSSDWSNGSVPHAGAVTWGNGTTGISGVISAANSLVGTREDDHVGDHVAALTNGNYLVVSPFWSNSDIAGAGAVTLIDGATGLIGTISPDNSLVGSTANDHIGYNGEGARAWVLTDGNAVIISSEWDHGAIVDAGAFTWINSSTGLTGPLSAANSTVGSSAGDRLGNASGFRGFTPLGGGRFAIVSPSWSDGTTEHVGAVTWGDGAIGTFGAISAANSLVGSTAQDFSNTAVTLLSGGNYVVNSPDWTRGGMSSAGAVTWIDASAPRVGAISSENSLVGSAAGDHVGRFVTPLANGNYVVTSSLWDNGSAVNAGAATWASGDSPLIGEITPENSLVGRSNNDSVGNGTSESYSGVVALNNGNYVVLSPDWSDGATQQVGAATWARGSSGIAGNISDENSIVGTNTADYVGGSGIALANGNAVLSTASWNQVGAVTWMDGTTGLTGAVSSANSLVGSSQTDMLWYVTALPNGSYVVGSSNWAHGESLFAGAAVWSSGRAGLSGEITESTALFGTEGSQLGTYVNVAGNNSYLVYSGVSITLGRGTAPLIGPIDASNSAISPDPLHSDPASYIYDALRDRLIVGWHGLGAVTVFQLDDLFEEGFD